jgi:hypothetical protein
MTRKSQAQMKVEQHVAQNRELSDEIERVYKEGEHFAQHLVDKLWLGYGGVSSYVQSLIDEGKLSDRKGVWLQFNQTGNVVMHVSLYKPDTHMPIRYLTLE